MPRNEKAPPMAGGAPSCDSCAGRSLELRSNLIVHQAQFLISAHRVRPAVAATLAAAAFGGGRA